MISRPPRFLNADKSGLFAFASLPHRSSRAGSLSKLNDLKSYSGFGGSNTRYLIVPSARLKSAGLASGFAETIRFIHPLDVVPLGAVLIASLPCMKPGKNDLPLLSTPP